MNKKRPSLSGTSDVGTRFRMTTTILSTSHIKVETTDSIQTHITFDMFKFFQAPTLPNVLFPCSISAWYIFILYIPVYIYRISSVEAATFFTYCTLNTAAYTMPRLIYGLKNFFFDGLTSFLLPKTFCFVTPMLSHIAAQHAPFLGLCDTERTPQVFMTSMYFSWLLYAAE